MPNFISLARLFSVPVIVWFILRGWSGVALGAFAIAALSDAVDGALARWLDARTTLGAYLDALADKLLLMATYAVLGSTGAVSPWLVIAIISRDIFIMGGFMLDRVLVGRSEVPRPAMSSKVNTGAQMVLLILILASDAFVLDWAILIALGEAFVGLTTLVSGGAYAVRWVANVSRSREAAP